MKKETTGNIELNLEFEIMFSLKHTTLYYLQVKCFFYSVLRWMNDVAVYIENLPKRHDAIALWNKRAVFFDSHELHSARDVAVMIV